MAMQDLSQQQELLFDLRQTYVNITTRNLELINIYLISNNFPKCYELILDTFPIIYGRIKKGRKEAKEIFDKKNKEAITIFTGNSEVYLKRKFEYKAHAKIKEILREMVFFLYRTLDEAGHFGISRISPT